ncbi:methyl-accepting chemotaxis protein [Salsuginibacillus halophilus]|uniref:Methyl-accepting chemotaxis protein n=1 Tax=Salsuginibacillus halophilus TaxID=517424 RepID=A0A2P8H8P1_9BACI|nr:HAMP domain-containing methyl-accepting chemotaxis protein [Salsuginibacillus halophilus]PSL42597.1 methyl-accepting chemotaxis protein [Salsuginibacillus halophilus]
MKWTLRKKLVAGFTSIALLLAAVISLALIQMNQMSQTFDFLVNNESELQSVITEVEANVNQQSSLVRSYLLNEEEDELQRALDVNEEVSQLLEEAEEMAYDEEDQEEIERLWSDNYRYRSNAEGAADLDGDAAVAYANQSVIPLGRSIRESAQRLGTSIDEDMAAVTEETLAESSATIVFVSAVSAGAVMLSILAGVFISNRIARPIRVLSQSAVNMAEGDLTGEKQHLKSKDEIHDLNEAFEAMKENLRGMISRISAGAESVAASSEEMKSSAEETSNATNQITESIQEVAGGADRQKQRTSEAKATAQEINDGMGQIAETVEHVSEASVNAGENAANGVKVIDDTVAQMETIDARTEAISNKVNSLSEQSEQIDQIISLIGNIAEQTNLLALNAAIEAARAGEHGKGFAVVADEVRKLAEQSNASAQEISTLISEIQGGIQASVEMTEEGRAAVQSGMNHVGEARTEFSSIKSAVQDVTGQIQQVAAAVEEMSAGTGTLNQTIETTAEEASSTSSYAENVAASAEEQMASMEEVSSAAESLSSMAEELEQEVSQFKVKADDPTLYTVEDTESQVVLEEDSPDLNEEGEQEERRNS